MVKELKKYDWYLAMLGLILTVILTFTLIFLTNNKNIGVWILILWIYTFLTGAKFQEIVDTEESENSINVKINTK